MNATLTDPPDRRLLLTSWLGRLLANAMQVAAACIVLSLVTALVITLVVILSRVRPPWKGAEVKADRAYVNTVLYDVTDAIAATSIRFDPRCKVANAVAQGDVLALLANDDIDASSVSALKTKLASLMGNRRLLQVKYAQSEDTLRKVRHDDQQYRNAWIQNTKALRQETNAKLDAALTAQRRAGRQLEIALSLANAARGAVSVDEIEFRKEDKELAARRIAEIEMELATHDVVIETYSRGLSLFQDVAQNAARIRDLEHELPVLQAEIAAIDDSISAVSDEFHDAERRHQRQRARQAHSPVDGIVWHVRESTTMLPGDTIVRIAAGNELFIEAFFTDLEVRGLSLGREVELVIGDEGPLTGTIAFVDHNEWPQQSYAFVRRCDPTEVRVIIRCDAISRGAHHLGNPARVSLPGRSFMREQ